MIFWKCDHCGKTLDKRKDYRFVSDGIHEDMNIFDKFEDLCDGCLMEFQDLKSQVYEEGTRKWKSLKATHLKGGEATNEA